LQAIDGFDLGPLAAALADREDGATVILMLIAPSLIHLSERKSRGAIGDLVNEKRHQDVRGLDDFVGGIITGNGHGSGPFQGHGIVSAAQFRVDDAQARETRRGIELTANNDIPFDRRDEERLVELGANRSLHDLVRDCGNVRDCADLAGRVVRSKAAARQSEEQAESNQ
jgi:hypothetical protein